MMKLSLPATLLLFFVFCGGEQIRTPSEEAAVKAARDWLTLVDSGQYAESWENASDMFRNAVEKEEWVKRMQALREPMGKLKSREVSTVEYKTSLPGAPDGEYVVIVFNSSFTGKENAVETVTPMKAGSGGWKVSGYYMR